MKIVVGEEGELRLKNVYNSVVFETDEGEELIVCMRDGAFEIAVRDLSINPAPYFREKHYRWFTASSNGITERLLTENVESDTTE